MLHLCSFSFFFFNDTATTEIYTLSLHDTLPICRRRSGQRHANDVAALGADAKLRTADRDGREPTHAVRSGRIALHELDRKSTRLNSSHSSISYAVFCLKKKKKTKKKTQAQQTVR